MLADAIGWALPELRAEAEQNMTSTCTITRPGDGELVTDPDTGEVTEAPGALVYSGKCRVRPAGQGGSSVQVGGAEAFTFDYLVSVPFAATGIAEGHLLTIDSSPDPALAGVAVEIQRVDRGDQITARRLACSEVA